MSCAVDLSFLSARQSIPSCALDFDLTISRSIKLARTTDLAMTRRPAPKLHGYIAGGGDGIVTAGNAPVARSILCMRAADGYTIVASVSSLDNGHYLIPELDPNQNYLVICRDHEKQYEPTAYDNVTPATDLTFAEQQALYKSWQEK